MIQLDKIATKRVLVTEKGKEERLHVRSALTCYAEVTIPKSEIPNIPHEWLVQRLKQIIWHNTYGELTKPLMELERIALLEVPRPFQHRVEELCRQINTLLNRPNE